MYTMRASSLETVADALEVAAGATTAANDTVAGQWKRIALAAEVLAGASTSANDTIYGWMLRATVALESIAGTSGAEETDMIGGILKRLVDALEEQAGGTIAGSVEARIVAAMQHVVFNNYRSYGLVLPFTKAAVEGYWKDGTRYHTLTELATYTRTGIQGAVDTFDEIEFFAANTPPINNRGFHNYVNVTNLLLNAGSAIVLVTQNVAVAAQAYTLSFIGTGTITLSGASAAGPLVGTGPDDRVVLVFTPSAGTLTLTVSGDVRFAGLIDGNIPEGGPIIETAGTTMQLGFPDGIINPYPLANEDQIFEGAFDCLGIQNSRYFMEWSIDGSNRLAVQISSGGLYRYLITSGGATIASGTTVAKTAGRQAFVLRRKAGAWSLATRAGGATNRTVETTAGMASGTWRVNLTPFAPFDGQVVFLGHRVGTFSDAQIDARLLELEAFAAPSIPAALSRSDFEKGIYRLEGATSSVTALWVEDLSLNNKEWDPVTDIAAGIGIQYTVGTAPFSNGPSASAAHKAVLPLTTGISGVIEGQLNRLDDDFNFGVWLRNSDYTSFQYAMSISDHNGQLVKDIDGNVGRSHLWKDDGELGDTDLHKIAFTLADGIMAISVDGGPVSFVDSTVDQSLMTDLDIWTWNNGWPSGTGTVTIRKCVLYPQVGHSVLPYMSS